MITDGQAEGGSGDDPQEPILDSYEDCDEFPNQEPLSLTQLKIRRDVPSGTIIIDRPAVCNALARKTQRELIQCFEDFHRTTGVRAIILASTGNQFCAGTDLKELADGIGDAASFQQWHQDGMLVNELLETMLRLPIPIIATVQGPACGIGVALALAADIVLASPEATFALPEPKLGLVATQTAPLLSFRIGAGPAARLLLTGQTINSDEAFRVGVAHELVPSNLLWVRAQEIAKECAQGARESLQLTKQLLNETIGEQLAQQQAIAAANAASARTTETATEGVKAFVQKRKPSWNDPS